MKADKVGTPPPSIIMRHLGYQDGFHDGFERGTWAGIAADRMTWFAWGGLAGMLMGLLGARYL